MTCKNLKKCICAASFLYSLSLIGVAQHSFEDEPDGFSFFNGKVNSNLYVA